MPIGVSFRQIAPRVLVVVLCGAALFALLTTPYLLHRLKLQHDLAAYRQELRSRGEKLTLEELGPTPSPTALQAGSNFLSACETLTNFSIFGLDHLYPGINRNQALGNYNHVFLRSTLPDFETGIGLIEWPDLALELEKVAGAQRQIQELMRAGNVAFAVDYSDDGGEWTTNVSQIFCAVQVFHRATLLHLHQGHFSQAHADLLTSLQLLQSMEQNAFLNGPSGCVPYTFYASWELLQYDLWDDQQLCELQRAWEAQDYFDFTERSLSISRALLPAAMERCRHPNLDDHFPLRSLLREATSSPLETAKFLKVYPSALDWCARRSYRTERYNLAKFQIWLEAIRDVKAGKPGVPVLSNAWTQCDRVTQVSLEDGNFAVEADPGYHGFELDRALAAEAMKRIIVTAIALKRYHLQKGKYPASLSELTPTFLSSVPLDPMDLQPLRYGLDPTEGYFLYSIGLDGTDEGGSAMRNPIRSNRLSRSSMDGSDLVWPHPATPAEVEELLAQQQAERESINAMKRQHGLRRNAPTPQGNPSPK